MIFFTLILKKPKTQELEDDHLLMVEGMVIILSESLSLKSVFEKTESDRSLSLSLSPWQTHPSSVDLQVAYFKHQFLGDGRWKRETCGDRVG